MIPVAIIFENFGPYHIARLQASARELDLLAIELAGVSAVYSWENDTPSRMFNRITLIEQARICDVSRRELIRQLHRSLDQFKPAVVVIPGWATPDAWGAMCWCLRNRVPMICMSESTAWDEPRAGWKEWIKRKLLELFSSALVGGERHQDYLMKLGMHAPSIFFGYDAVDNAYFSAKAETVRSDAENMRRRYDLPGNYFLASARFVEKKNLSRLLEAFAIYHAACESPWSLVLLGDGPLRPALESKRDALGLRDHVAMPGFKQVADLPAYYALARAFVHPSTVEPWGLVVNEAMACGLPVLVSDRCGCAHELVSDGVNGFTFDPTSVEDMARQLSRVSAPDFPVSAFGQNSRKLVSEWGPERFAQGLRSAVEAALKKGPSRPAWLHEFLLRILLLR